MSGTGYDLSSAIYSQDGRIFQLEYALKVVEGAETVIGVRCADGVILACEKTRHSALETADSNPRIHTLEAHIGLAICGSRPDGEYVLAHAKKECENYRENFDVPITGAVLAERVANFVHAHTLYMSYRPLGCAVLISAADRGRNALYLIDNSGSMHGYFGCALGKGRQPANVLLERLGRDVRIAGALPVVARAIASAHEEFKEKSYELEVSVVGDGQGDAHHRLDSARCEELRKRSEEELEAEG